MQTCKCSNRLYDIHFYPYLPGAVCKCILPDKNQEAIRKLNKIEAIPFKYWKRYVFDVVKVTYVLLCHGSVYNGSL